ncbi:hypothetical protein AG1IA_09520 [Rhizoctonia solani AG-1 IA]|uniref:Uncharacterized protein n=1 Tax=Thanatephorus cucumeris (strain AG1-IA) TaxID=983506 RepID=L8WJA3_THACA|nr:hypothetical protein AG1IA_09520 [Rhizoctonia solani AG-1 IA]
MLALKSDQYVADVLAINPNAGGLGPTVAGTVLGSVWIKYPVFAFGTRDWTFVPIAGRALTAKPISARKDTILETSISMKNGEQGGRTHQKQNADNNAFIVPPPFVPHGRLLWGTLRLSRVNRGGPMMAVGWSTWWARIQQDA